MNGDRSESGDGQEDVYDICAAFESVLADVAKRLANVPDGQFDGTMIASLQQLVEFLGCDRSSLLAFSPDGRHFRVTHTWAVQGVPSAQTDMAIEAELPWYTEQIRNGHIIRMTSTQDLPTEAVSERSYVLGCDLKSVITVPLIADENVAGAISFGSFRAERRWPPGIVTRFRLIGEVLGLAIQRQNAGHALKAMTQALNREADNSSTIQASRTQHLRRLAAHLLKTRDKERRRIGEVLHEDVMQVLAGVKMLVELPRAVDAINLLPIAAEKLREALQTLRKLLTDTACVCTLETGIIPAIRSLADKMRQTHDMVLRIDTDGAVDPVSEDTRVFLYEAARELLVNVASHARARHANLDIRRVGSMHVRLSVTDDGVGFDPANLPDIPSNSFGLFSIHELVELLGGQMELRSAPGRGTYVSLTIPV